MNLKTENDLICLFNKNDNRISNTESSTKKYFSESNNKIKESIEDYNNNCNYNKNNFIYNKSNLSTKKNFFNESIKKKIYY